MYLHLPNKIFIYLFIYKNYFFCEMGLFTLHNFCVSWLLNFLKLKLDSQSRLTIPEFSGYHCISNYDYD